MNLGKNLTASQQEAIQTLDRNVAVSAGAGTGKTRVLVERFLGIVQEKLASPPEILAITYTEKAANEMKSRIVSSLKSAGLDEARRQVENAYIGTIHAFCARLLKEHPIETGIDPDFRVIEEDESDLLKETALDQLIEESFEKEDVFSLLLTYGEESVRKSVKSVYDKIRMSAFSLAEAVRLSPEISESSLRTELIAGLDGLPLFPKRKELAVETIQFLTSNRAWDQPALEALNGFAKAINLKIKEGKSEAEKVKDLLKKFSSVQLEKSAHSIRESFTGLLLAFGERYDALKRERAAFDFADLELTVTRFLSGESQSAAAVRAHYRAQFKFIMVDEFQDTSAVQMRLADLLSNGRNLFFVGDVKQSIYGFRGSDPDLFRQKETEFKADKSGTRIVMSENFRSSESLLNFVNPFFSALWRDGSIAYEPLAAGRQTQKTQREAVELIEVEQEENETRGESRSEEARVIAARIQELVETEGYAYGDFAMLFRASEGIHLYEQELLNLRIPYYVIGGRGFYHQAEIRDMMNFLTVLENPLREIPLASLLRSPMFGVSDDTLFWLSRRAKAEDKLVPFFNGLAAWREIAEISQDERQKLERFEFILNDLSRAKRNLNVSEILEAILRATGYDLHVLGLRQGKRHFANLRKLVDLARELEARETIHLGDYIRYIKGLVFQEARESEAQTEAAEGNVVRLMTIHKAKGLEFRAVILPDLSRQPRVQESRFLFDSTSGVALQVFNAESGEFENTFSYQAFLDQEKEKQARESKRLLYVAMTRAKEKLIFAGTAKPDKEIKPDSSVWFDWIKQITAESALPMKHLSVDAPTRGGRPALALAEKKLIRPYLESREPIPLKKTPEAAARIFEQLKPLEPVVFERVDLPVSAFLTFGRDGAHEEFRQVYELGAFSVSPAEKPEEADRIEEEERISPAEFGTLVHKIFEHIVNWQAERALPLDEWIQFYGRDFGKDVRKQVRELAERWMRSDLFSEAQKAKRSLAELPFVLRLKHGVVQGTLDLLYETPGGDLTIVDYKTSEVTEVDIGEKGESYREQMELYALACHEILGKLPKRALLYFAKPARAYEIKFQAESAPALREKFERRQQDILEFRRSLHLSPSAPGSF